MSGSWNSVSRCRAWGAKLGEEQAGATVTAGLLVGVISRGLQGTSSTWVILVCSTPCLWPPALPGFLTFKYWPAPGAWMYNRTWRGASAVLYFPRGHHSQTSPREGVCQALFYLAQLLRVLLFTSELLLSQPVVITVISLAEFVRQWFLVLVTLWVNLYKQGFRGVKGEKGEPGQPGLDGLDAPCQLVQYFSFLLPCMQFPLFMT